VAGAGFDFGLVAFTRQVAVPAGKTVSLPVLFVGTDLPAEGPGVSVETALAGLKQALLGKPAK
jgi:hypothetical protein